MELYFYLPNTWMLFSVLFAALLVLSLIMNLQSAHFITKDGSTRKFSILDLEFPSSPLDLVNTINGIYKLPDEIKNKAIRSLKNNLYLDFLFMPAIYGCVFLLCMHVSNKSTAIGHPAFAAMAWLQLAAWVFDIIENIYLLRKIKPDSQPSQRLPHQLYHYMVLAKWAIALFGGICSLMVILYYFISGNYHPSNLVYSLILIAEVVAFMLLNKVLIRKV